MDSDEIRARRKAAQMAAKAILDEEMKPDDSIDDPMLDPPVLLRFAQRAYSVAFQEDNDLTEEEVFDRSIAYFRERRVVEQAAFISPPFQMRWMWAARWFQCGMPRIVWEDARLPISLMMTKVTEEVTEHVIPPWPAFIVDLPPDLLFTDFNGEQSPLTKMLVQQLKVDDRLVWNYLIFGPKCELWRHGISVQKLIESSDTETNEVWDKTDAQDIVAMNLAGRLIVGLCLTLSDPSRLREAKHTKSNRSFSSKFKKRDVPKIKSFVVGGTVKHDCRQAVKEALMDPRKRGTPSVRILVRGHWKLQAWGPQHTLRKPIHVEPYWRGEEGAPILLHDHEISDKVDPPTSPDV